MSSRLLLDDEESFKEAAGSLHFNNPSSDPNIILFHTLNLANVVNSSGGGSTPQEKSSDT